MKYIITKTVNNKFNPYNYIGVKTGIISVDVDTCTPKVSVVSGLLDNKEEAEKLAHELYDAEVSKIMRSIHLPKRWRWNRINVFCFEIEDRSYNGRVKHSEWVFFLNVIKVDDDNEARSNKALSYIGGVCVEDH